MDSSALGLPKEYFEDLKKLSLPPSLEESISCKMKDAAAMKKSP